MAYDSKTYGQSPFGNPQPAEGPISKGAVDAASPKKRPEKATPTLTPPADDGLDEGPEKYRSRNVQQSTAAPAESPTKTVVPGIVSRFPNLSDIKAKVSSTMSAATTAVGTATAIPEKTSSRKSKSTTRKSKAKTTGRKSRKSKAAQAEAEAEEQAVERRFFEEDRNAYVSLLYKIGISGLVWAVLRLLRHELSEDAIAVINALIDPITISTVALICTLALTFWVRRLLNDLARHTRQLHLDAEAPDGKSFRPTLEIVGDSLEYNPQLRKNMASFFNAASILLCSLISYLVTFALFPTDG